MSRPRKRLAVQVSKTPCVMKTRFSGISLGNFKAFAEPQNVPLRPITLLYGPNSAGKSTIIHSFALIQEAVLSGSLDISRPRIGGSSIDLGGFARYVFNRDQAKNVEWTAKLNVSGDKILGDPKQRAAVELSITFGVPLDDIGNPIENATVNIVSYEVLIGTLVFLRMSGRTNGAMAIDSLNGKHPVLRAIVQDACTPGSAEQDDDFIDILTTDLIDRYEVIPGSLIPTGLKESQRVRSTDDTSIDLLRSASGLDSFAELLSELLGNLEGCLREALDSLDYLGPLRTYPSRSVISTDDHDSDWRAGGAYAWDVVRSDSTVRSRVNAWLGAEWLQTPYVFTVQKLISMSRLRDEIFTFIEERFPHGESIDGLQNDGNSYRKVPDGDLILERDATENATDMLMDRLLESTDNSLDELVITDRRTETIVSHRDIGIGVSQVLPVLVSSYASRNGLLLIEQPEIHLHPALQSELADVFIESALGPSGNRFVLETHSEHLMLRILKRIRETADKELPEAQYPITPADVSVLYVEPTSEGTIVHYLQITEDGDFETPWPQGFFAERARELY